jgi:hypothetical protein
MSKIVIVAEDRTRLYYCTVTQSSQAGTFLHNLIRVTHVQPFPLYHHSSLTETPTSIAVTCFSMHDTAPYCRIA